MRYCGYCHLKYLLKASIWEIDETDTNLKSEHKQAIDILTKIKQTNILVCILHFNIEIASNYNSKASQHKIITLNQYDNVILCHIMNEDQWTIITTRDACQLEQLNVWVTSNV
jgi:hypothetical protein